MKKLILMLIALVLFSSFVSALGNPSSATTMNYCFSAQYSGSGAFGYKLEVTKDATITNITINEGCIPTLISLYTTGQQPQDTPLFSYDMGENNNSKNIVVNFNIESGKTYFLVGTGDPVASGNMSVTYANGDGGCSPIGYSVTFSPYGSVTAGINNAGANYFNNVSGANYCFNTIVVENVTEIGDFTITAKDYYDLTILNNFTTYIYNSTQSWVLETINGTLKPPIYEGSLYNFTFVIEDYFNITYDNYNISNNLEAKPYQAILDIFAQEIITNYTLKNFNISISNLINETNNNSIRFYLKSGNYNITFFKPNYYNLTKSISINPKEIKTTNINNVYNSLLNLSAKTPFNTIITNFSININSLNFSYILNSSTLNGSIKIPLINGSYFIVFDTPNYELKNYTLKINSGINNYTLISYVANSIQFYFRDIKTKALVGNVSLELISTLEAYNYSTPNGTIYLDLLIPENYTIRYNSPDYRESFYYFNLINRTFNNLTLYLIKNSSSTIVTATIYNEISDIVEGATIKALKYDVTTNSYILQEEAITNFEGQAKLNLILNAEFYKFIIEYGGEVKKITEPSYIYSTDLAFQILTGTDTGQLYNYYKSIAHSLVFNPETSKFRLTYSDTNGAISQACLKLYRMTALTETLINTSCSSSTSGVLLVPAQNVTGATYKAVAYVYFPDEYLLTSMFHTFRSGDIIGNIGLFGCILLTIFFFCFGFWRPILIPILTPIPSLLFSIFGLINLDVKYTIPIQIGGLIIAWIISDRG